MKITKRQLRRLIKEQLAQAPMRGNPMRPGSDLFADVQDLVGQGTAIMDMADKLNAMGHRGAEYVSAMGMRYVQVNWMGRKYVIISKNSVTPDPETRIIGPYAVGIMG